MRIPIILLISLLVFTFCVDAYIWADVKKATDKRGWRVAFWITTLICWIFLIVTLCMPRRSEDADLLKVMWMLYTFLSVYIAKLGYVVCSLFGRLIRWVFKLKSKIRISHIVGIFVGIALFATMWEGVWFTRRNIVVNRVTVDSPMVPSSFNGYRIAQISDIHVGTWGNDTTFISALVDSVNSLHPDLIVFTGDIVNRETRELLPFVRTLSRLQAKDGVKSVLGNHDYGDYMDWRNPEEREVNNIFLSSLQAEMGWDLMNNERRIISNGADSIVVVGVENIGDPPFPSYGDLEKALPISSDSLFNQNDRFFKILLSHNPAHWDGYISHKTNIALTLSGHTHAMQMVLKLGKWEWSPAVFRYPLWGGMYERLNDKGIKTNMYVNIGSGEVGMPSRLLSAYPEITLFTLHHVSP
ncbi:MAG: metallophosphoesterase [Muribaculaceae bacterium]|nr:metallophosphoesterase [Muribaculaceae bacterium]